MKGAGGVERRTASVRSASLRRLLLKKGRGNKRQVVVAERNEPSQCHCGLISEQEFRARSMFQVLSETSILQ
jgi:hypothetical protein